MSRVTVELVDRVLCVTIDNVPRKNALTMTMYDDLSAALERAEDDRAVHVVLLTGAGGQFCSGNDVGGFPPDPAQNGPTPVLRFVTALVQDSVPIVAAVEGVAAGLGATMLLHLDSVVAARNARIVFPFVNLALAPEAGSTQLLPQLLGYTRAAELILRGGSVDGAEAHRLGIASQLAEPGAALHQALAIAGEMAAKPPQAMRRAKRLLKGDTAAIMARIHLEERALFDGFASAEAREAMRAFREKRPPDFSNC